MSPLFEPQWILLPALQQHHINRSFISHQKLVASPRVKTLDIEQTGNLCLLIYLFSFVQTFPSSTLDRASESQSYHFSVRDFPAEKTKLLKKRPKWLVLSDDRLRLMLTASGETESVCVCGGENPTSKSLSACVCVRSGLARHAWL